MEGIYDPSVPRTAKATLNGLAHFLEYVELPSSAEQVRNFRDILESSLRNELLKICTLRDRLES